MDTRADTHAENNFSALYGTGCALSMLPLGGGGGGPTVFQHVCLLQIKLISPYMYAVLCVTAMILCFQLSGEGEKNRVLPPSV